LFRLLEKLKRVKPSVGGGRWSVTAFAGGLFKRVTARLGQESMHLAGDTSLRHYSRTSTPTP
jgi:hypothetical protein